jgi:NifU-like protein involved in Fe-S cluster formation
MINDVYNKRILELAANIERLRRLDAPDASATALSRLCGSKVTVDIRMDGDVVSDFGHDVKACALGQASSSLMARHVVGASAEELRASPQMYAMLKEDGDPPGGRWAELEVLLPVRDFKPRHASTLLTFDAVVDAIDKVEAARKAAEAPASCALLQPEGGAERRMRARAARRRVRCAPCLRRAVARRPSSALRDLLPRVAPGEGSHCRFFGSAAGGKRDSWSRAVTSMWLRVYCSEAARRGW